jgi:hypothetical protein
MRRARVLAPLALAIAVAGGAATGDAAIRERIKEMSHYHPPGATYSFVCAHVQGKRGKRAVARISGPYVVGSKRKRFRFPKGNRGKYTVTWPIKSRGRYTLTLSDRESGERLDRDSYFVPSPPPGGARRGPFKCPETDEAGWYNGYSPQ